MSATLQLRLIPAAAPLPAQAGYLPGTDVMAWLEEMARHPRARFYVAPNSVADAEAGGLVIVPINNGGKAVDFGARVLPCLLEHGCVVVPAATRLDPLLTPDEAKRLLTYPLYFFHPTIGLVAFEEGDAITPEALIVAPLPGAVSWLRAAPGHAAAPKLTHVMLMLPDDAQGLFGEAANDIGSQDPRDLKGKAPLGERLTDGLLGGAAAAGAGLLKGLGGLAGMLGGGGGGGSNTQGLMDRLQQWSEKQMEKLQQQREKEVQRLLKLLETNPEMGLRFAIPFGGGGDAARGQAPPSGALSERNPIFGARRGSGPADVWNFSDQTSWTLQQRYRDLANREIAEGRFDRAAYIFAELLGDWHAAAGALARGKRYQEAARIYERKLNNKRLAATCLEDGCLFADAVVLYADLGEHEKCGDLLRKLGREREAVTAYQQALKGGGDRLNDARILFEKLQQHGLAIAVLASGYPDSAQARQCLERHFEYLNRLHATSDALALAAGLAEPARQLPQTVGMAEMLHAIHEGQPDGEVQGTLARVALQVIGTGLTNGTEREQRLLDLLPKFAPSDLLLKRDVGRYEDQRTRARRKADKSPASPSGLLTRRSQFKLPQDGTQWRHLASRGNTWLASGYHESTSQDVWVLGKGEDIAGKLTSAHGWGSQLPLKPLLPALPDVAWLPFARKGEAARYGQARRSDFSFVPETRDLLVARLSWMPPGVLAVQSLAEGTWVLHANVTSTVDLSFFGYDGKLVRTHALGWTPPNLEGPVVMATHGEDVFISAEHHILHVKNGTVANALELPLPVLHLTASARTQAGAVLANTGQEVVLLAPGKTLESIQLFSTPRAGMAAGCFLADGRIVVGDDLKVLVYSAYPHARHNGSVALPPASPGPLAGYAAWGERGLAILHRNGEIECYE